VSAWDVLKLFVAALGGTLKLIKLLRRAAEDRLTRPTWRPTVVSFLVSFIYVHRRRSQDTDGRWAR
jgi:hypothetical protein